MLTEASLQHCLKIGLHQNFHINDACGLVFNSVLRIRIHMFLGLLDPDPDLLVRGMDPDPNPDPDPSTIKQK